MLERTEKLIQTGLSSHEKQFAVKGLELAGSIIEILEVIPDLSSLSKLVILCLDDADIQLKQYAAATVGDLVIVANNYIFPFLPHAIEQLTIAINIVQGPDEEANSFTFATNNAVSSLGEISIYNPDIIAAKIPLILEKLVPIIKRRLKPVQVQHNILAAVGKFGFSNPEVLALKLPDLFFS